MRSMTRNEAMLALFVWAWLVQFATLIAMWMEVL